MTSLERYDALFAHRVAPCVPTAADAARALYTLNLEVKPDGGAVVYQTTVYSLKAGLLEAFYRAGYATRVTYDAYAEPKPVYGFTFAIMDAAYFNLFSWHCIEEDVDWNPDCIDVAPPPNLRAVTVRDARTVAERIRTIELYLKIFGRSR